MYIGADMGFEGGGGGRGSKTHTVYSGGSRKLGTRGRGRNGGRLRQQVLAALKDLLEKVPPPSLIIMGTAGRAPGAPPPKFGPGLARR